MNDDFYGRPDSCYIRILAVPDKEGFQFSSRNEFLLEDPEHEYAKIIEGMAQGLLFYLKQDPARLYQAGLSVIVSNKIEEQLAEMPEGHQIMLKGNSGGTA